MSIFTGIMTATMLAYNGSGFSEHLIPTNLSRSGGVPWWAIKQKGARALYRSSKGGSFHRSGVRHS